MDMVSIIIPTYNAEVYISQVIESILSQTLGDWELIIVDDGSKDNTLSIVKKYTDPRIHLLYRTCEPKGSVTCRNIGQRSAKGKYFIHFDADDIIMPFCLEQRVRFMERHPSVDFATFKGRSVFTKEDGNIVVLEETWGIPLGTDDLRAFLSTKYPYSVWNNIYRSASFMDYFWDEKVKIYTDFSYIVPSLIQGKQHAYDYNSKEDYWYRTGLSNAMTHSFISNEKYVSTKYLFSKTLSQIESTFQNTIYRKDFYQFFKLQFQRILLDGSEEQAVDFYQFVLRKYPEMNHFQIRIAYLISELFTRIDSMKIKQIKRKLVIFVLQPNVFGTWIKHKMGLNKSVKA